MKKHLHVSFIIVSILTIFCFAQCKKENNALNITLYDKPLGTIQSYIQGKWKLHYGKGGICGSCMQYYDSSFWKFNHNNKIEVSYKGAIITDTTINWIKNIGTFTNGDSTFIMSFFDKLGYPANYVVDKIINDTLILHENTADAVFYHFTKL
ncbi:hypothetical protein [Agriterribacter sp.]|uniref:hypothetical protein n=1 Tax=Agriterribacter sp. TaxID=2821509 RepID=UPI002BBCA083|nr:hypothetical protein [Agriterribacter sp.]HRP54882.1 hypothetical protein [Agriterribacter sp.]